MVGTMQEHRPDNWWDRWFLGLARYISTASKDPSTQVGAVLIGPDRTPLSWGYNGFPRGLLDTPARLYDRPTKYKYTLHAEDNALDFATQIPAGSTLYTFPFPPCSRCALRIIQRGVSRVVAPFLPEHLQDRWGEDCALAFEMFTEAKVRVALYPVDTE